VSRLARFGASVGLGIAIALTALGPVARPMLAAATTLTIVTKTTYDVLPDENRVAVTVEITATNLRRDTATRHYYAEKAYLAVLPGTSNFQLKAPSGKPSVKVNSEGATSTVLLLQFGSQLGAGKSLAMTLTFDIEDPGGAPERPLRISPSLVAFQAWAFGSDGVAGSTVRVRLPAGYAPVIGRGPLSGPSTEPDGHLVFETEALPTPETFVADVFADRPGVHLPENRSTTVNGQTVLLMIRFWPDDPDWRIRVTDLLQRGLPALGAAIGIGWPSTQLEVRETIVRPIEGSGDDAGRSEASVFDPVAGRLDIPYLADPTAILHGATHGWFNAELVADRWIAEGFAALYAERAGTTIGVDVASPKMTEGALAQATPLNAWVAGSGADDYGYAAALLLARAILDRAGDDALRDVWRAAASGIGAYQVGGWPAASDTTPPETGAAAPDWRSFLDLLEARTGRSFEGLWRAWVVRPADAALLDARSTARALYDQIVSDACPWTLPRSIRDALRAWQFDSATAELEAAADVLEQREDVARAASAAGLLPPDSVRLAFEGTAGLQSAAAEALTELAVIGAIRDTVAARPAAPDLILQIGLLGSDGDADVAAARNAFAAGDLDAALRFAAAATNVWTAAPEVARGRIVSGTTLGVAILLLVWLVIGRRRRKAR